MSRKEYRFTRWLVWCAVLGPTSIFAQNFDPVVIGQSLNSEVQDGSFTNAQFSDLQKAAIENFLSTDQAQTYFNTNFEVDGVEGELKNGKLVTDWETLAKAMGTSGAVLAGAYSLWRQRRREQLSAIAGGDISSIEAAFETAFGKPSQSIEANAAGHSKASAVEHATSDSRPNSRPAGNTSAQVPPDLQAWETWASHRGLTGSGATIALLFGLWNKQRLNESKPGGPVNPKFVTARSNTNSRSVFLQKIREQLEAKRAEQVKTEVDELGLSAATKPTKPQDAEAFERYRSGNIYHVFGQTYYMQRNAYGNAYSLMRSNWPKDQVLTLFDRYLKQTETAYGFYINGLSLGQRPRNWTHYPFQASNALTYFLNAARRHIGEAEYQVRLAQIQQISPRVKAQFESGKVSLEAYRAELAAYDQKQAVFEAAVSEINQTITQSINGVLTEASLYWQNEEQKQADQLEYDRLSDRLALDVAERQEAQAIERETSFENLLLKATKDIGWDQLISLLGDNNSVETPQNTASTSGLFAQFVKLKSGNIKLDVAAETLFEKPAEPASLSVDEIKQFIAGEKATQSALQTAQKQRAHYQALQPQLPSLIANSKASIDRNQQTMQAFQSYVKSYNQLMQEAGRLRSLAYRTGYYNRRNGRFYPNRSYLRQAYSKQRAASSYARYREYYYSANSAIAAAKRNLAQYRNYETSLPNLIQSQEILIAESQERLKQIQNKLAVDPGTYAQILQDTKTAKIKQLQSNFNRWLRSYTGYSDYYQWSRYAGRYYRKYNWQRRSYWYSSQVRAKWQSLQNEIRALNSDDTATQITSLRNKAQQQQAAYDTALGSYEAQIADYKELQAMLPTFNRMQAYVRQVAAAQSQSRYFAKQSQTFASGKSVAEQISALRQKLQTGSPYKMEIAQQKSQLARPNKRSFQEYLSRSPWHYQRYHDPRYRRYRSSMVYYWNKGRQDIGRGSTYWENKFHRYYAMVKQNRLGYSDGVYATLESLAKKAHQEKMGRYNDWQKYYREHPLTFEANRQKRQQNLSLLEQAQTQWKNAIEAQIAKLEAAQSQSADSAYQQFQWLNQSSQDRQTNGLTQNILASEFDEKGGAQSDTPDPSFEGTLSTLVAAQRDYVAKKQTPANTSLHKISRFDPNQYLTGAKKILDYYATPEGQAARSRYFDQKALPANQKRDLARKNGLRYDSLDQNQQQVFDGLIDRGLSNQTLKNAVAAAKYAPDPLAIIETVVSAQGSQSSSESGETNQANPQPTTQVNGAGEIDTRSVVETAENFDGLSSENPSSIAQAEQIMNQLAWMQNHRRPAVTEKLIQLLAGVSADKASDIQNQLNQKTAEITNDYAAAKKAKLTNQILNLKPTAKANTETENPLTVSSTEIASTQSFEAWIDGQLAAQKAADISAETPLETTHDSILLDGVKLAVKAHTLGFVGSLKEIDSAIHEGVGGATKQASKDLLGLINLVFSGAALAGSLQKYQIVQDILLHKEAGRSQRQVIEFFQANKERLNESELLAIKNEKQQFGAHVYTVGTLLTGLGQLALGIRGSTVSSRLISDLDTQLGTPDTGILSRISDKLTDASRALAAKLGLGDRIVLQGANGQTYSVPANQLDDLVGIGNSPVKSVGAGGTIADETLRVQNLIQAFIDKNRQAIQKVVDGYRPVKTKLDADLNSTSADIGIPVENGPLKALDRIGEKAFLDYDGDIGQVKDIVRSRFIVKNSTEKDTVIKALKTRYGLADTDMKVFWDNGPNGSGYRSINIKLNVDGKPVEIQVVPDTLVKASETGRGHQVYEELRTLKGIRTALENDGKTASQSLKDKIFDLEIESKAINQQAWTNFNN